ncbi:MAG TPA: hypothetical protein ENK29_00995 [Chromatiales bacterium]|nr:hypothetical protein [Chromatiales bacterium]
MKLLFTALIVLVIAVVITLVARDDPGYIVINFQDWTIETSFILASVALGVAFVVFYLIMRVVMKVFFFPGNYNKWRGRRRDEKLSRKSHEALTNGVVALINGRWKEAERELMAFIEVSKSPVLNYLFAARAAEKLGAHGRRDEYLNKASELMPKAETAIGLTRAELLIQEGKMDRALKTLEILRVNEPKQEAVTKRLLALYHDVRDWHHLLALLPTARKRNILSYEKTRELEILANTELLNEAGADHDVRKLHEVWQHMDKDVRKLPELVSVYVNQLMKCNSGTNAEMVLSRYLQKHWDENLVYLYGLINGDTQIQLSRAETWLRNHKDSFSLMLTLGRLYKRDKQWDKARQYLESCLAVEEENAEVLQELAGVVDEMGESEKALLYYRKCMLARSPETVQQLEDQSADISKGALITAS